MSDVSIEGNLPHRQRGERVGEASSRADLQALEYAAVLNQLDEGVIVTDTAGQITFVNEAAVRLHGVKKLQVDPDSYSETYHLFRLDGTPYPSHELPLARSVLKGETVVDARWLIRRPDGTEILAIGTATPLVDQLGIQQGSVLTIRDDTARHAAELELSDLNATLEDRIGQAMAEQAAAEDALRQGQKMEAVGQLTGGIAHDFNNLLTVVLGSADLLSRRLLNADDPKAQRHLDNIMSATNKAAALTQRLLAFSRRQPLDPKPTNINALITDLADLVQRSIGETIVFETVLGTVADLAIVDAPQLENVILNLALNARDAMPGGGNFRLETALRRRPSETSEGDGRFVAISAIDDGIGMSPELMSRVFEPFFTTKEPGKGTGLGLSMIYGFVKQSGGHIEIESSEGQGTAIHILLPLAETNPN